MNIDLLPVILYFHFISFNSSLIPLAVRFLYSSSRCYRVTKENFPRAKQKSIVSRGEYIVICVSVYVCRWVCISINTIKKLLKGNVALIRGRNLEGKFTFQR